MSSSATVISRLNIRASELSGELNSLKAEESELSESVRSVEEDVRGWRREREWESRSGMADLQAEIIRLKRELEVSGLLLPSAPYDICGHYSQEID